MDQDDIDKALEPLKPALVESSYALLELGAKVMTERIVAWLHEVDSQTEDGKVGIDWIANEIERGAHLEGLE